MSSDASKPRLSVTGSPDQYQPTYGNPVVSTSNDVAKEKGERRQDLDAGAKAPLKVGAVGGNTYPGRALPPVEQVKVAAPCEAGFAKKQADKQMQEQRQDLK